MLLVKLDMPHNITPIFLPSRAPELNPVENVWVDEAAILDGANPLQVLWHIILPLSRPALATVAILSGLAAWNLLRPTLLRRRREPHRIERVILP